MSKDTSLHDIGVQNIGEPIRITDVEPLGGVSAEPGKDGQKIKIWTKLALTSDEQLFHRITDSFVNAITHLASQAGTSVNLRRADTVLLVLKPKGLAELWVDTAAISMQCAVKRSIKAGTVIFERDIADITGMSFPCVDIGKEDQLVCLFRQDWRFALAFDTNPDGELDLKGFERTLGSLYRQMKYRHLYDGLGDSTVFNRLIKAGWFPFVEIINSEFKDIFLNCEADFDLTEVEEKVLSKFDPSRTEKILERWMAKSHFSDKEGLLKSAINAFNNKDPFSVIKILLTEIEGVLNGAHRAAYEGQGAKLNKLLAFAELSAERKAGGSNTLLFPKEFGRYLKEYTFGNFDPSSDSGSAGSRHAVGHGAASQESYTMTRALQAILTLDQLAFYT